MIHLNSEKIAFLREYLELVNKYKLMIEADGWEVDHLCVIDASDVKRIDFADDECIELAIERVR